jgi:hypothetical protein
LKSSGASPRSELFTPRQDTFVLAVALSLLVTMAVGWCYRSNCILFYGDAQAHLDTSRMLIDSRTLGYSSVGTVWLPLLHLLCLPFVASDFLWSTGLAGSIPVALCFVLAGIALYRAAVLGYGDRVAALVSVACVVLNPNLLYLASIPMTEIVFLAGFGAELWALMEYRSSQRMTALWAGVAASVAMSLTRYDGWFLIPFEAIGFAWCARHGRPVRTLLLFLFCAALAPTYWLAHNWWQTGNALDFFNGPYSPQAIQAGKPYPGFHDWISAARYYFEAGRLFAGAPLLGIGAVGLAVAVWKRVALVPAFLVLTPLFYLWSVHSSGLPIHVPGLWPHSYYNTRYALALSVLVGFCAGAIVLVLPPRFRRLSYVIPLIAISPWLVHVDPANWICWKESFVNSVARRFYRNSAAGFLAKNYHSGQGILLQCCGDVTGILAHARIPLKETIHEGNGPWWEAAVIRPDLFHPEEWALAREGDPVAKAMQKSGSSVWRLYLTFHVSGEPSLNIYRQVRDTGVAGQTSAHP